MESNEKEFNEKCKAVKEDILRSLDRCVTDPSDLKDIQEEIQKRLAKEGISIGEKKLIMQAYKEFRKMPIKEITEMYLSATSDMPKYIGYNYFEWTINDHLSLREKILYPSRFYKFVAYGEDHNDKDSVIYEMIDKFEYNNEIYCYLKIIAVGFYTVVEESINFYKLVKNEDKKKDKLVMIEDEKLIEELKKHFTKVKDLI